MSKLAHSCDETMADIELDAAMREGVLDEILDRDAGLHFDTTKEKLIEALRHKRGTSLRYPEVRAILRFLLQS